MSDESALEGALRSFFPAEQIVFYVVHGDITTTEFVNASNAAKEINKVLARVFQRYPFKKKDICQIMHVIDTDGAFIAEERVAFCADAKKIRYKLDCIETATTAYIKSQNRQKSEVVQKLFKLSEVNRIPYRLYYLSRNMEHVLHNRADICTDEEKRDLADQFVVQYEDKPEDFRAFISDAAFAVQGSYQETWRFIFDGTNSLHRHTNLHLALPNQESVLEIEQSVEKE